MAGKRAKCAFVRHCRWGQSPPVAAPVDMKRGKEGKRERGKRKKAESSRVKRETQHQRRELAIVFGYLHNKLEHAGLHQPID